MALAQPCSHKQYGRVGLSKARRAPGHVMEKYCSVLMWLISDPMLIKAPPCKNGPLAPQSLPPADIQPWTLHPTGPHPPAAGHLPPPNTLRLSLSEATAPRHARSLLHCLHTSLKRALRSRGGPRAALHLYRPVVGGLEARRRHRDGLAFEDCAPAHEPSSGQSGRGGRGWGEDRWMTTKLRSK